MKVPFLDLTRQYEAIRDEIDDAIRAVLESGRFILGAHVRELEQALAAYCGAAHGIGVGSGTDALRLVLEAMGVGAGAEVITSPFTFVATAEMVSQLGAVPVFVDIEPATYALDPGRVRALDRLQAGEQVLAAVRVHDAVGERGLHGGHHNRAHHEGAAGRPLGLHAAV